MYIVGWTGVCAGNNLWFPTPPKSVTKDDTKARWVVEHMQDEPILPFVGLPSDIVMLSQEGHRIHLLESNDFADFPGGCKVLKSFFNLVSANFTDTKICDFDVQPKAIYLGFNIKQLFHSLSMVMLCAGYEVPPRLWYNTPGLFDISNMLIPGDLRNGFDIGSLLQFFAESPQGEHFHERTRRYIGPGQCFIEDALDRAIVARDLACCAGLLD